MRGIDLAERYPIVPFDPNSEPTPVYWLIEDLWQLGKINAMFGREKSGKSRLLGWLLAALLSERDVLGLGTRRVKRILYLAGEETQDDITTRLKRYLRLQSVEPGELPLDFIEAAAMRLDFDWQREWMEKQLLNGEYDVLVIDPLRRVHGADENKSTEMAGFHNDLRRWSNRHGITTVLLHHTGRLQPDADMDRIATWGRGTTDLAAIVDTAQFVDRVNARNIRLLRAGRFPPLEPLHIVDASDTEGFYAAVR